MAEDISHEGLVRKIGEKHLEVAIVTKAACVSCQMNKVCNPSDAKEKIVEVPIPSGHEFVIGQAVTVSITAGMSLLSILLAYLLPVIFLFAGFFTFNAMGYNENVAAGVGLASMLVYFGFLYILRDMLKKKVNFRIA